MHMQAGPARSRRLSVASAGDRTLLNRSTVPGTVFLAPYFWARRSEARGYSVALEPLPEAS